ncbi:MULTISPECIES: hypothetical protein [Mycobacteriaceae]|uniref:hypothetical protein n=1 Tax=Mycobacteriaceae TaxID=1762 RepID=UPI0035582962
MDYELDQLLHEHFGIETSDFIAALKALPVLRPWAAALTETEAHLLDDSDFTEGCAVLLVTAVTRTAGRLAQLVAASFTTDEVARGLGASTTQVHRKRRTGELWAVPRGHTWGFPVVQFDVDMNGVPRRQVHGLSRVFATLPRDLHPVAVAEFLHTPQLSLFTDHAVAAVEWLRGGGPVEHVIAAAAGYDWHSA